MSTHADTIISMPPLFGRMEPRKQPMLGFLGWCPIIDHSSFHGDRQTLFPSNARCSTFNLLCISKIAGFRVTCRFAFAVPNLTVLSTMRPSTHPHKELSLDAEMWGRCLYFRSPNAYFSESICIIFLNVYQIFQYISMCSCALSNMRTIPITLNHNATIPCLNSTNRGCPLSHIRERIEVTMEMTMTGTKSMTIWGTCSDHESIVTLRTGE